MVIRMVIGERLLNVFSVYEPQVMRTDEERRSFVEGWMIRKQV